MIPKGVKPTASELEQAVRYLGQQIDNLSEEQRRRANEWALLVSPWKVNERTPAQTFSSYRGDLCRVTHIRGVVSHESWPKREDRLLVRVTAMVLKKDGSDSLREVKWDWWPGKDQERSR